MFIGFDGINMRYLFYFIHFFEFRMNIHAARHNIFLFLTTQKIIYYSAASNALVFETEFP